MNYHNDNRAPLLFISGSEDHLMPPSIQRSNLKHYKSNTVTEIKEFDGPHLLPAQDGWEQVADYALDWAVAHATGTAAGQHATASAVKGETAVNTDTTVKADIAAEGPSDAGSA